MIPAPADPRSLPREVWGPRRARHEERLDALTARWRAARERGERHPIEDFLFTYYSARPSRLRRWHPGPGVILHDAPEHLEWRWYRAVPGPDGAPAAALDLVEYRAARSDTLSFVRHLLAQTAARPGAFGCFGLHEWAMVYRDRAAGREHRHPLPLRLGSAGTDAVVESHRVSCSHYDDAYRFFTPEARPRNELRPSREAQAAEEQPGCLHAGMDLFKWALKLGAAVPGELLLDTFELARDIRYTDMAAAPYDVSGFGVEAVAIETAEGKGEYVRRQRRFTERGQALRERLLAVCEAVLQAPAVPAAERSTDWPGRGGE